MQTHKYDKSVKKRFCDWPFIKADITYSGDVYFCCWTNRKPIGNVFNDNFESIWNSTTAREIRESIINDSFKFCDLKKCYRIGNGEVENPKLLSQYKTLIIDGTTLVNNGPEILALNYDNSCNLSCPSCRTQVIQAKKQRIDKLIKFQKELLSTALFNHVKRICLSGTGEVFSSRVYSHLLQNISQNRFPNLKMTIHTNATLLKPAMWSRYEHILYALDTLTISIDAAQEDTYSIVRRGGNWSQLMNNLKYLSKLRADNDITVDLNFVVQDYNFNQMPEFVQLVKKHGFQKARFSRIFDYGAFSGDEYQQRNVHSPAHPLHSQYLKVLEDPMLFEPEVDLTNLMPVMNKN